MYMHASVSPMDPFNGRPRDVSDGSTILHECFRILKLLDSARYLAQAFLRRLWFSYVFLWLSLAVL